jgi:hypothetical protein
MQKRSRCRAPDLSGTNEEQVRGPSRALDPMDEFMDQSEHNWEQLTTSGTQ